ncbi:MAG: acyl--CoA ligase [Clostridia bacterium]|nr:acyl--CoA ligase [Clostridia bacterium]
MMNKSMYDFLFANYNDKQDDVAICFLYKNFSYAFLKNEVDKVACFLVEQGIKKGDVVTVALPNIPSSVSVFYAINKIGAIANMVHPLVPYALLKERMQQTNSKLLFAFDLLLDVYFNELINDGFKVVVCKANDYLTDFESFFYTHFGKKRCKNIDKTKCLFFKNAQKTKLFDIKTNVCGNDVAVIMHSSGTTDKSKSACLSNEGFNYVANNVINVLPWASKLGKGMASLAVLPTFHAFGLGVSTHTMLSFGYQSVMIPKYSAKLIVKKIRQKNVAIIAGVPTMFAGMVEQKSFKGKKLKKLKFAFCGGDKLADSLKNKFDTIVASYGGSCVLDEGYGLTEVSGVLCVNTRKAQKQGSVGKPVGDTVIVAFDENGKPLPNGTMGELCVSSPAIMKGYLQGDKLVDDGLFVFDDKRFVKTGDFGYVDEQGFVFFKQRQKRIEKVSGVNVFPAEAEHVILHIDGVKACCVKGVAHNTKGVVMKAFVVADDGVDHNALIYKIKNECDKKLDKWTQPKFYEVLSDLPLTPFGKVDYKSLR